MADIFPRFADLLGDALAQRDLPQTWLARQLGVSSNTVNRWLTDYARPGSPEMVVRIADILSIDRAELLIAAGYGYQEGSISEGRIISAPAQPFQVQFQSLIKDATTDFVGREYVFGAIDVFLANQSKGYFTIEGDPGMGKTAILARYVQKSNCIAYFNERLAGRNRPAQFLENVCKQLISRYNLPYTPLPPKATEDGSFLLQLLDEISLQLDPSNKLVIAVDALDEVDLTVHTSGANILYLPERLPDHIYFVMTRRRMDPLPLRVSVPHHHYNLLDYHLDSQRDVQMYIRQAAEDKARQQLQAWMARQTIEMEEFVMTLAEKSEDNFMYLYHVLWALNDGQLYHDRSLNSLPVGLQGYYHDHWRHMRGRSGDEVWFKYKLPVIVALTAINEPVSIDLIQDFSKVRKRTWVREVLKEWVQFLREVDIAYDDGVRRCYRLYHTSFHDFVAGLQEVEDERVDLKTMHGQIANTLWNEVFGDE